MGADRLGEIRGRVEKNSEPWGWQFDPGWAQDDIEWLLAEIERLTAALRAIVENEPMTPTQYETSCGFCGGFEWHETGYVHDANCEWAAARALLASGEGSEQ